LSGDPKLERLTGDGTPVFKMAGAWTAQNAAVLERLVGNAERLAAAAGPAAIDLTDISKLDTFGAWLIERLRRSLTSGGTAPSLVGLSEDYRGLVDEVHQVGPETRIKSPPTGGIILTLDTMGRAIAGLAHMMVELANMTGAVVLAGARVLLDPRRFRFTSMVHHLEQVGWRAVPIIVLITFLIGCIIAQQGIFHFRKFGADVYVVDMVGILVLREIGVLIVTIMVAGRSGSAYTAELGSMKMREEVDALRTMGFDPVEVLVLPRVLALLIALPILTFVGSMAALYGGGLVSWLYGGMQPDIFLARLRDAISLDTFKVGMIKAPFMALVIGIVACVEGFAVRGSAESLGRHTTASVVKAIFFVIVFDGFFAIFFASIGM
jgi:phospholipid/cholesterol/gamma-HCH transport system permease protein